jgi:DNA-binding transcriptional ArsR family regulator
MVRTVGGHGDTCAVAAVTGGDDVLRLHFTPEDLLGIRFASRPAPLMELGLAVATLQRTDRPELFARWRAERRRGLRPAALPLLALVPPNGAGPLFLDPLDDTVDVALDGVRSTAPATVSRELSRVFPAYRPVTPWVRRLAANDGDAWQTLDTALRASYYSLLAPYWNRVEASFTADLAWRSRMLVTHGTGTVLSGLYPGSRWREATLHLPSAHDTDVAVGGLGLTLMPSTVWTGQPLIGRDNDGRRLLLYPALTPFPMISSGVHDDSLADLLGGTRSAVLRSAAGQRTVSQIAADLRISPASASEHCKTLSAAGLLGRQRDGKTVWHLLTPLGADLLSRAPSTATARGSR